ncbi:hypothetical protein L9F63_015254 [Diploptera punctata]|uniref:N-acetyltransferase ESCO2 n=1 Tax=Diploptera punctata TaxID=6984 RepID=A0AAD8A666_DIPPU|nr:hypothetical protein L9F63_015254 [Diploptera punctata]
MSENCITPKSARKRIIFSGSPTDEGNSDDTLGHMSPLMSSSSPDRYSSPPPSPQWLTESVADHSPCPSGRGKDRTPKSNNHKYSRVFGTSVFENLQPFKTSQINRDERMPFDTELVKESPLKDSSDVGLMTPFKSLASKDSNVERTPKLKRQKLIIGETPDVSAIAAPVKLINKFRAESVGPTPEVKSDRSNSEPVKLKSLPIASFYSSRARAALFPEHVSHSRKAYPNISDNKRKRSHTIESFHSQKRFPVLPVKTQIKRRKLGEINVGVGHKIKKFKKKVKKPIIYPAYPAQPKITPADRIISYLDKVDPSILNSLIDNTKDNIEQDDTEKNTNSLIETGPDPVEREPSPPPDSTKKFFKSKRTLNKTPTVTVDKNFEIKVSKGKSSTKKPGNKVKTYKNGTNRQTSEKKVEFEPIDDEKSKAEAVQETIHDNVEILIQKLVESPVKDVPTQDENVLSPNHHITALASSTSFLAISDDPVSQNQQFSAQGVAEMLSTPPKGNLFEDLLDDENRENTVGENQNRKEYFPVFYKRASAKKLADLSNVNSRRGVKRPWKSIGEDQYIIDAGQKKFGATQCKECGTVYQIGDPDDERAHEKFHDKSHCLKYSIMKNERIVTLHGSDKIILVRCSDSKNWLNKVKTILTVVDEELGYCDAGIWNHSYSQVYFYVTEKQIAGCVVVHPIQEAYKMLKSVLEGCDCCSEEAYPAKCAISRIWVNGIHRRKKIATKLLDSVRSCFIQGYLLGKDEIAFSAPTVAGKAFAEQYTGTENYLVYT